MTASHVLVLVVVATLWLPVCHCQVPSECRVSGTTLIPLCHWQQWFNADRVLPRTLNAEAQSLLTARRDAIEKLGTSGTAWKGRQEHVRSQVPSAHPYAVNSDSSLLLHNNLCCSSWQHSAQYHHSARHWM